MAFLGHKNRQIDVSPDLLKSVLVLAAVIEARDAYTGGHTWRVAQYSRLLARQAGLSDAEIFLAGLGGFIHDLGKVGIPDQVLNKKDRLSDDEFSLIKTHPSIGKTLLSTHPLGPLVLDAVTHHHERFDGRGYPTGDLAADLSIYPRIVAIADSFDALTSSRPYRRGRPKAAALAVLFESRNRQFDGALVAYFLDLDKNAALEHTLGHSDEGRRLVNCPMDGPIMAIPRQKQEGDSIYCHACKGIYRLHIAKESYELESLQQQRFDLHPEVDQDQINDFTRRAPRKIRFAGDPI
jgi:HD-GYP domain-containing protein (c-di-GMP phosphodiesterase class II)